VSQLRERFGVSERRACAIMSISRTSLTYRAKGRDCCALRMRIREIAASRVHYGCERVFVVLRREGWRDNHKRVHRLYKAEGLSLRHCRPRRSRSGRRRQPRKEAFAPNELWGMDFVSDALFDGRRFRALTIVDHYTHECLGIVVDQSLRGEHVADAMTWLAAQRGRPAAIKVDNVLTPESSSDKRVAEPEGVETAHLKLQTCCDSDVPHPGLPRSKGLRSDHSEHEIRTYLRPRQCLKQLKGPVEGPSIIYGVLHGPDGPTDRDRSTG
jgi:putative transposase